MENTVDLNSSYTVFIVFDLFTYVVISKYFENKEIEIAFRMQYIYLNSE